MNVILRFYGSVLNIAYLFVALQKFACEILVEKKLFLMASWPFELRQFGLLFCNLNYRV